MKRTSEIPGLAAAATATASIAQKSEPEVRPNNALSPTDQTHARLVSRAIGAAAG